jgi:hypothetical protein
LRTLVCAIRDHRRLLRRKEAILKGPPPGGDYRRTLTTEVSTMPGRTWMIMSALAATASATVSLGLAHATPVGPCADVPYVGVCVPASEQPSPPTQNNLGELYLPPDTSAGFQAVS